MVDPREASTNGKCAEPHLRFKRFEDLPFLISKMGSKSDDLETPKQDLFENVVLAV